MMETYYGMDDTGDLRELWDNDFGEESMKFNPDQEMITDWFTDRDIKVPHVILNDKLMSDAILGGMPIKTEHSYSLNSDGESMPHSPEQIDDMEEECYPSISMNAATNGHMRRKLKNNTGISNKPAETNPIITVPNPNRTLHHHTYAATEKGRGAKHEDENLSDSEDDSSLDSDDVDIDDSMIKEEPLSPSSSCPPSPAFGKAYKNNTRSKSKSILNNIKLSQMAALTNTDLVFEHMNGSMHLSPASQSLLKTHQTNIGRENRLISKLNIKMEPNTSLTNNVQGFNLPPTPPSSLPSDDSEDNQSPEHSSPMSPPITTQTAHNSSSSSSGSSSSSSSSTSSSSSGGSSTTTAASSTGTGSTTRRSAAAAANQTSSSGFGSGGGGGGGGSNRDGQGRLYSTTTAGPTTRQPIHTPLISNQPKGSTGMLLLTEEEKRTLLAEGYPIPTRLPLTKAEEKSLKKIRRKIKNKISAQESRRKKKEYMDQLERKVDNLMSENIEYRKRVESLEGSNASLMNQLAKLQTLVNRHQKKN